MSSWGRRSLIAVGGRRGGGQGGRMGGVILESQEGRYDVREVECIMGV